MKRLSMDDISNAPSLPEKEIEIPEWDATVLVTGLTKADAVEINELSETDGIKDEVLFEKHLLLKGLKDPQLDDLKQVEEFYSKATPSIVDKVLIGIYRCMAWTKEDQASIASEFPE
jgi:hypothetical protein|tara:strand:- start:559 stop:909 length:351 start_codon:yes stop_codon:yes gene_type:complete